jgi:serine/threonine protein kinase
LLDRDGYCVIIDLGFAKVVPEKTYTLCGTPLYLAPEIILSRGYDKGVDNWSFAALIYEMLMGFTPFYSHKITQMILFKRIVRSDYCFPDWADCSETAIDLIERVLVVNPNHRLGALAGGDSDIRNHPWLASVDPADLMNKSLPAPWVPHVGEDEFEGNNFENWDHVQRKLARRNQDELVLTQKEQERFKDF